MSKEKALMEAVDAALLDPEAQWVEGPKCSDPDERFRILSKAMDEKGPFFHGTEHGVIRVRRIPSLPFEGKG